MKHFLVIVGVLFCFECFSNVSVLNGNFYISYTDLILNSKLDFQINRVYNSKASFIGIFGKGWGSDYEVYLRRTPADEICVHENGGGALNSFNEDSRKKYHDSILVANMGKIAKLQAYEILERTNQKNLSIDSLEKIFMMKYKEDPVYLQEEFEHFLDLKKIKLESSMPIGTIYFSKRFGSELIIKTPNGYERSKGQGIKEYFDTAGRLLQIINKENYVAFEYDSLNRLKRLYDNDNHVIYLFYNSSGYVERILTSDNKVVIYHYSLEGYLIYSKDVDGNIYEYSYDDRWNMTKIKYKDGSLMKISYNGLAENETVNRIENRDGSVMFYRYDEKNKGSEIISVRTVQELVPSRDTVERQKYEFMYKKSSMGQYYCYKKVLLENKVANVTIYDEYGEILKTEIQKNTKQYN
jgi:YD repeat-containing protein